MSVYIHICMTYVSTSYKQRRCERAENLTSKKVKELDKVCLSDPVFCDCCLFGPSLLLESLFGVPTRHHSSHMRVKQNKKR